MFKQGELPPPFGRLALTDQQRSQIQAIFEASRPVTDSILRETMPQLQAMHDSVRSAMQEVLTPEQLEQLEQLGQFGRPMEWRRGGLEGFRRPPRPWGTPDSLARPWGLPDSLRRRR
jgi:Spy/CpxP family protein refolding chaperone